MTTLLGKSRAQLEEAKKLFKTADSGKRLALGAGFLTILVPFAPVFIGDMPAAITTILPSLPNVLAVIALGAQLYTIFKQEEARKSFYLGEEGRRRAILVGAFGKTEESIDFADLHQRFTPYAIENAERFDDENYYDCIEEPAGRQRLLVLLQESLHYSKHLYQAAAERSLRTSIKSTAGLLLGLVLVIFLGSQKLSNLAAQIVVLAVGFLASLDWYSQYLCWVRAAKESERADRRLQRIENAVRKKANLESLLAIFADYSVATVAAPPIPCSLYEENKEELAASWQARSPSKSGE